MSWVVSVLTSEQMNYAVVILAFVFVLAFSYWHIRGKYYYTGPRVRAHVVDGAIVNEENSESGEAGIAGKPAELDK